MKMNSGTTPALDIGLDVHKEKTTVAIADPGANGEIRHHGEVAKNRGIPLSRISVCHEAGGCGMRIARMFLKMEVRRNDHGPRSHVSSSFDYGNNS
jgi:transposase